VKRQIGWLAGVDCSGTRRALANGRACSYALQIASDRRGPRVGRYHGFGHAKRGAWRATRTAVSQPTINKRGGMGSPQRELRAESMRLRVAQWPRTRTRGRRSVAMLAQASIAETTKTEHAAGRRSSPAVAGSAEYLVGHRPERRSQTCNYPFTSDALSRLGRHPGPCSRLPRPTTGLFPWTLLALLLYRPPRPQTASHPHAPPPPSLPICRSLLSAARSPPPPWHNRKLLPWP
jgi:hypothetical protein